MENNNENNENNENNKNNKNKIFALVGIVSLVLVAALSIYTIYYINNSRQEEDGIEVSGDIEPSGSSIVVKEDNRDYLSEINDKVERGMIQVRMTQNWVFQDGCKTSNAYLANSVRNTTDMRFVITLADTGEVIMTSPDVPVGSCIEDFPLSVELEPGVYDAVIAHQQVENGEVINTVRTSIRITVK